eukprot:6918719-Prymnesium_polylepis.1
MGECEGGGTSLPAAPADVHTQLGALRAAQESHDTILTEVQTTLPQAVPELLREVRELKDLASPRTCQQQRLQRDMSQTAGPGSSFSSGSGGGAMPQIAVVRTEHELQRRLIKRSSLQARGMFVQDTGPSDSAAVAQDCARELLIR